MSTQGIRVIAVALADGPLHADELPSQLTLVGIVGVLDEIREESREALRLAQNAGIQVVMITGDKRETAVSVAEQVIIILGVGKLSNCALGWFD